MTKQDMVILTRLEQELNQLPASDDLTAEAEAILDRIAWYCINHNISPQEYDTVIARTGGSYEQ